MKKLLFLLTLFLAPNFLLSQEKTDTNAQNFATIEIVPIIKGCKLKKDHSKVKKCVIKNIQKTFSKNFNSNVIDALGLPVGEYRTVVKFTITKNAEVEGITVKTSISDDKADALKKELIRVVKLFEFKKAATQNGKPVNVKYTFPMKFEVS